MVILFAGMSVAYTFLWPKAILVRALCINNKAIIPVIGNINADTHDNKYHIEVSFNLISLDISH